MQILVSMAFIQCLLALVPTLMTWQWPQPITWACIVAAAFAGLAAQYCMARSYALADAMVVAPVDFFRLPLIAVVGLLLYGEHLDPWTLAGGGVIVVANLINLWSERRRPT
jgi:drug/metabolite transporter (DMT)-like permease